MKETRFIDVNKKKWAGYEETLSSDTHDPDKLKGLFIGLTDDLSYSRTFYERRSLSIYLNNLAQKVFYLVYKNKSGRANKLLFFWKEELPSIIYECRKSFLVSLALFSLAFLIGIISSQHDPGFSRTILGDNYVRMTESNIESGDPMAVYKSRTETSMFLGISWNNLRVSFLTFVFGLFFGFGTIGILFTNGVMVGTFQYFFIERGLFWESFLSIWMHGTIEISCIVIAGAAGITMGRGLLFPGTITRLQSLQLSAGKGLKIMIGIVPLIVIAAFIEGFFTRYTDVSDIIRFIFIFSCLLLILGYFVYYPWRKSKTGFLYSSSNEHISPQVKREIDYSEIKSTGEIIADLFHIYRTIFKRYLQIAILASLGLSFSITLLALDQSDPLTNTNNIFTFMLSVFEVLIAMFDFKDNLILYFLNTLFFTVLILGILYFSRSRFPGTHQRSFLAHTKMYISYILVSTLLILSTLFVTGTWSLISLVLMLPIFLFSLMYYTSGNNGKEIKTENMLQMLSEGVSYLLRFYLFVLLISTVLLAILLSPATYFLFEIFQWNLRLPPGQLHSVLTFSVTFSICFVLSLLAPILVLGIKVCFYSVRELHLASVLKEKIDLIGRA